jgi:hypothetical protein
LDYSGEHCPFVLRYWPLAVLGILVIAILAMSRYAENRKQSNKGFQPDGENVITEISDG